MIKVALIGLGKTGQHIANGILEQNGMRIVSAICSPKSAKKGMDLGELLGRHNTEVEISASDELEAVIFKTKPDIVVDFSSPAATMKNAVILSKMKVNMIIGTTGFTKEDVKKLQDIAYKFNNGIVYAPNITLGVNVLMTLTNLASILLNNYDFHISEIHHKNKKDSPSGTALKIAKEIEKGLLYSGKEIDEIHIPIDAVRAGGVVGKHEVLIVGNDDRITISHESFSRKIFADGAINAIKFIQNKTGFYEMSDVLNLSKVMEDLYVSKQPNAM